MKPVKFELNGQIYSLLLTGAALFDAYDRFGDKGDLMDHLTGTSRESFDNTVWMLVNLAKHGEAYRRYMGEDAVPMLSVEQAVQTMGPRDVIVARAAIREALSTAFARTERSEEEEIDEGLLELQKKTARGLPVRFGLAGPRSFLGFLTKRQ